MKTPSLPENFLLETNDTITLEQYLKKKSIDFTRRHVSAKRIFTTEDVRQMLIVCQTEAEMPDDTESYWYELCEECCQDLERSNQLQKDLDNMPDTQPNEPAETLIPEPTSPATTLEVVPDGKTEESLDAAIVAAACKTRLDNGYSELASVFEFGEGMLSVKVKEGAIATSVEDGALLGFGLDLGKRGFYLALEGANRLLVKGKENSFNQICAQLGIAASTLYGQLRALPYFTPEARQLLAPTVIVEIATAKFSDDPKENDKIKTEMVAEAIENKWDSGEARSAVRHRRGVDEPIDPSLSAKNKPKYLLILPGQEPLLTREEPVWSEGATIISLKTMEVYKDIEKKLTWCKIAVEPTNEELK